MAIGYIHAILDDAQRYASHRTPPGNPISIRKEDIRLATQARIEFTKAAPPPREVRPSRFGRGRRARMKRERRDTEGRDTERPHARRWLGN